MTDAERLKVCMGALALVVGECQTLTECVETAKAAMDLIGESPDPRAYRCVRCWSANCYDQACRPPGICAIPDGSGGHCESARPCPIHG